MVVLNSSLQPLQQGKQQQGGKQQGKQLQGTGNQIPALCPPITWVSPLHSSVCPPPQLPPPCLPYLIAPTLTRHQRQLEPYLGKAVALAPPPALGQHGSLLPWASTHIQDEASSPFILNEGKNTFLGFKSIWYHYYARVTKHSEVKIWTGYS